jgi:hypothetical protein
MSSEHKPPNRRHSSSTVAWKTDNVNPERNGETAEAPANEDYYTRYPNRWSKIRSAMR